MLIFISGSINSGKTTTAKALAKRLNADFINVDDLNDTIPNFNLATDLDKSMDLAIQRINESLKKGKNAVANYVVRERDYNRFADEINTKEQYVITLAPRLEVAQSKRSTRILTEWEVQRVKHHYDTGIASPKFGHIIDNSDINLEQTVDKILQIIDWPGPRQTR
jgi:cytidylate kinase